MTIRLGHGLYFPDSVVTQTLGILAKRGAGKSNTGAVMAEGMFDAGLPFVVVDPVGAWWGLRSSADGKSAGLPIPIFGGYRGDVPLEPTGGELVADLIVDERLSCVLDVSAFESEGAKRRFLATFAERLFRRKGQPGHDDPLHLFLEEADDYAPQRGGGIDINRALGAFQRIVKQGRARGLGSTMITQRSAVLNKDLLTQIETLIVMRTTSPQDRKAIAAWVEYHGKSTELLASLHELEDGEVWVWSPWLDLTKRVQVRRRRTFDSGATPSVSTKGKRIATLADIDLGAIQTQMAETIERAKADDPRELRRRIRELEQAATKVQPAEQVKVEVPVVPEGFQDALTEAMKLVERTGNDLSIVGDALSEMRTLVGRLQGDVAPMIRPAVAPREPALRSPVVRRTASSPGDETLGKADRAFLTVMAQFPDGRSRTQLAVLAGYAPSSRHVDNILGSLRARGLVQPGQPITATEQGLAALGEWTALPRGDELFAYWLGRREVGTAGAAFLRVLREVWPGSIPRDELAERAGYTPSSRHVDNVLGNLRTLELVARKAPIALHPEFAEALGL